MPNRIIKESVCYSESIKKLSWFEEVFFYRLIVNADDYGRLDGRLEMLQAKLFPLRRDITESTISKALNALTAASMVQVYMYDQKPFLQLTAWERHQQVRARKSKFPEPDINGYQLISNVPVIQSLSESLSESNSNDIGQLAPPKPPKFKKPSFDEIASYCCERGNSVDPQRFFDHYESNGWMVGKTTMKDWKAAVRTWEKNNIQKAGSKAKADKSFSEIIAERAGK